MVSSQLLLLIILMVSSAVYCGKEFKEKLCQSNLSADVVTALGKCFDQRPPRLVTAAQTCMTQLGKTTVNEAAVRQVICDATNGQKFRKCMRENMRSSGTGSPPPTGTPSGSGESPRFRNHDCIRNALALQKSA